MNIQNPIYPEGPIPLTEIPRPDYPTGLLDVNVTSLPDAVLVYNRHFHKQEGLDPELDQNLVSELIAICQRWRKRSIIFIMWLPPGHHWPCTEQFFVQRLGARGLVSQEVLDKLKAC